MSERTSAQKRWSMAITKNDRIGSAFQRAEEVGREVTGIAEQLATLNESVYRINHRLDGLESVAKPATDSDDDPVCATCGHQSSSHHVLYGCCHLSPADFGVTICRCKAFVLVAEPDDPICQRPGFGHKLSDHDLNFSARDACSKCKCEVFLDPAPVKPPDDIDRVLLHIAAAYRALCAEGSGETDMDGMPELRVAYRARSGVIGDVHEEMLAYGRRS